MSARPPFVASLLCVVLLAVLLAGCGGGSDEPVSDDRKSTIPVVCKLPDGTVIPGNCV